MLKSCNLSSSAFFYYDLERKVVARFPSKSNLKLHGSDNSLYFGMIKNKEASKVLMDIFDVKKINDISGLKFEMDCAGDYVLVEANINKEGQMQIKLVSDGTMGKLANNYGFNNFLAEDFTKMLIVIDFANFQIRFKDPNSLQL